MSETDEFDEDVRDDLRDLPPSCNLVFRVVDDIGPCTQASICEKSLLSPRTVRDALARLKNNDLISERPNPNDGRQSLYDRHQ